MEILKRKVKALSLKRLEEGSIGFMTVEEDRVWFNVLGDPEVLKEIVKNVVAKGNTVEFEFNNGVVGNLKLIEAAPEKEGFEMTTFEDLLTVAHEIFDQGFEIKTEMISVDYEKSQALFKAWVIIPQMEVEIKGGKSIFVARRVFMGHGDAQGITNDKIKLHFIRMAETRAIVRALRWATNNAAVAVEETEEAPHPQ